MVDRERTYNDLVKNEIEHEMKTLFPYGAGNAPHTRVQRALDHIGQVAFNAGRSYALLSLLSVEEVATQFGVTPRRVRAIAKRLHDRLGIGFKTPRGDWLFVPEELDILRPGQPGRPKQTREE